MNTPTRERPILFTGEMVRAILEGRKTQTRRPVKWTPVRGFNLSFSGLVPGHYMTGVESSPWVLYSRRGDGVWEQRTEGLACPYGLAGDRLWVRETVEVIEDRTHRREAGPEHFRAALRYRADDARRSVDVHMEHWRCKHECPPRWTPGIHMPRWASRLLLEVTEVRVERLRAITEVDAVAEGVQRLECISPEQRLPTGEVFGDGPTWCAFACRWDAMYDAGPFAWRANPWVWVVTFRRAEPAGRTEEHAA